MKKNVKKYLRDNQIRIPLSTKMARYYLSIGEKCIIKYNNSGFFIVKLAEISYSLDKWNICKIRDIKYLINNLYYLHETVFLGDWSLPTLLVSPDVKLCE